MLIWKNCVKDKFTCIILIQKGIQNLNYLKCPNIWLVWVSDKINKSLVDFGWNNDDACKQGIILTGQQEAFGLNAHSSNQTGFFVLKREWTEDRGRQEAILEEQESHYPTLRKKQQMHTLMMSWWYHTSRFWQGTGDTYFQQQAVLETAQQKNDKTKERLKLEFYSS